MYAAYIFISIMPPSKEERKGREKGNYGWHLEYRFDAYLRVALELLPTRLY
jgi:hypothetical protein